MFHLGTWDPSWLDGVLSCHTASSPYRLMSRPSKASTSFIAVWKANCPSTMQCELARCRPISHPVGESRSNQPIIHERRWKQNSRDESRARKPSYMYIYIYIFFRAQREVPISPSYQGKARLAPALRMSAHLCAPPYKYARSLATAGTQDHQLRKELRTLNDLGGVYIRAGKFVHSAVQAGQGTADLHPLSNSGMRRVSNKSGKG